MKKSARKRRSNALVRSAKSVGYGVVGIVSAMTTVAHESVRAVVAHGRAVVRGAATFA